MGVRRAMEIVLDTANKVRGPLYTEGPLIHNPQVLEVLRARGVEVLGEGADLRDATVVVRAHGISPARRRELKAAGLRLRDATCPHVARVQGLVKKAARAGRDIVIVGDAGHAEVVGIQGFAKNGGFVVQRPEQVDDLPALRAVTVVAQTTQNREIYEQVCERLRRRFEDCEVHDTICDATADRQKEAVELAREVDAMVVVGGRESANTARLARLCESAGARTFLVETEEELDLDALRRMEVVGVTAGASTPTWMITRVVERLQALRPREHPLTRLAARWGRLVVYSNAYSAAGAFGLALANCRLMNADPGGAPWLAFLYVFSIQTLNMLAERQSALLNDPRRARFFQTHAQAMLLAALGAMMAAVTGAAVIAGPWACGLLVLACALGALYRVPLGGPNRRWRFRRLADIAGTREMFIVGAWVVATVCVPALAKKRSLDPSLGVAIAFASAMVFLRTIVLSIRDLQGDQVVGKETLATYLGLGPCKALVGLTAAAAAAVLGGAAQMGWCGNEAWALLACCAYAAGYLALYHTRLVSSRLSLETVVDGNFLLAGAIAAVTG